ncbi:MAG: hypothetical protein FWF75_03205 [Propionibacteriaceae bacterium]|nr:hypothetical protein [Propionibacteriaceae bacterium]
MMTIDCARCAGRGASCQDCVVQLLLEPELPVRLTAAEQAAVAVLASRGMLPRLHPVPVSITESAWPEPVEQLLAVG